MEKKASSFSGQIGFVLAAAGSAVGVGNLWRFPYLAAKDGGGLFLLVYLVLVLTFGFTLLTSDIAIGRRTKQSAIRAYETMRPKWKFLGILTFLVPVLIMTYYAVIGGWITKYAVVYLTGQSAAAAEDGYFTSFITSPVSPVVFALLFMGVTAFIVYNGVEMDLGKPFERITMVDAVKKYAGVDWNTVETLEQARALAKEHNVEFEERHKKGDILSLFFEEFAEEHLIQPAFVTDHPIEISPLTKKKPENPDYVERFEFFMNGWEMANAYSELNDPIDQRARFKAQEELLAQGDEEANTTDEAFLNALELGMPPTGGIGFGIDRMCMLLTDSAAIRDVLLFPTMKSQGAAKNEVNNAAQSGRQAAPEEKPAEKIDFSKVKIELLFEEMIDFDTFAKADYRAVKIEACEAVPKSKKLLKFTLNDGTDRKRTILSGIHEYYEPEELVGKTAIAIVNLPPRKMMGIDSEGMLISAVHEEDGREGLNLLMVDDRIPAGAKLY